LFSDVPLKNNFFIIKVGASFLQMEKVREACAKYLIGRFQADNVLGIRRFGDTLSCTL
jgi:kelch-like protein 18